LSPIISRAPKIVDERLGKDVPLVMVGGLGAGVFLCGALAQLAIGRLVERIAHSRGGFPLVLEATAVIALVFSVATAAIAVLVSGVERERTRTVRRRNEQSKRPRLAPGPGVLRGSRGDQKSMSPMPPPGPGIGGLFFGSSATIASVVMSRPATDAAP